MDPDPTPAPAPAIQPKLAVIQEACFTQNAPGDVKIRNQEPYRDWVFGVSVGIHNQPD